MQYAGEQNPQICHNACCGDTIRFCEYGQQAVGCIREKQPECPFVAVIPSITVEDNSNIKDLADCFVHIANTNTTIYIDDKHRMIVTWAGPVEVDDYNYENNPLNLRSQTAYDFKNNRAIYFNRAGEYMIFNADQATPAEEA